MLAVCCWLLAYRNQRERLLAIRPPGLRQHLHLRGQNTSHRTTASTLGLSPYPDESHNNEFRQKLGSIDAMGFSRVMYVALSSLAAAYLEETGGQCSMCGVGVWRCVERDRKNRNTDDPHTHRTNIFGATQGIIYSVLFGRSPAARSPARCHFFFLAREEKSTPRPFR